jgi:hypothetical protein
MDLLENRHHHEARQLSCSDTGIYCACMFEPISPTERGHWTNNLQICIDTPLAITADLLNIPFLSRAGTLTSEPDYRPPLRATFVHGSDFLRRDPDGQMVRLDVTSVARDESGALLRFSYNGVVGMTGAEGKVIRGDDNATTTGFGNACELLGRTFLVELLYRPVLLF